MHLYIAVSATLTLQYKACAVQDPCFALPQYSVRPLSKSLCSLEAVLITQSVLSDSAIPLDDTGIKYVLDIDTEVGSKLHEATKAEEGRLRVLKDARGRTFNCYLPVPEESALSDVTEVR